MASCNCLLSPDLPFLCIDTGPVEVNVLEQPEVGCLFTDTTEASLRQLFTDITDGKLNFCHRSFTFNSNKSPTWCNSFSVYYPDVYLQLNMFRAFSLPLSGAQWLQWQPLILPAYRGDSRAVFVVGPAGPTTNTAQISPRYEGKIRGCHCSHWAPDNGRENARNLLSYKQTSRL
jgi:hypothetical protein